MRLPPKRYLFPALGIVALCWPLLRLAWAMWFTHRHGCDLSAGPVATCLVDGTDWGPTLHYIGINWWIFFYTVPVQAGLLLLITLIGLYDLVRWIRRRRKAAQN